MTLVKIYGERNSGTIYLEWLLKKNLEVDLHESFELGWKHRLAPSPEELTDDHKKNILFVCLVKNPYSWLLSMHKRPYNHESLRDLSFSDFLKYSYGDYRNPMVMWNMKYRSYVNMENYVDQHIIIRYEDALVDIKTTLNNLAEKFNIEKPELYKNIKNLLTNKHGIKSQKFHRDFYIEEKWKKSLRPNHLEVINQFLDKDLMNLFNYSIL
ncbi:MAG: hypothetical protein K9G76_03100 [Bacteroidales bacterium]|nr:hypothetical protein [Bacteroidales bacterium]MCF8402779.1 hypothetical protein [Bacteroidales bacterium]